MCQNKLGVALQCTPWIELLMKFDKILVQLRKYCQLATKHCSVLVNLCTGWGGNKYTRLKADSQKLNREIIVTLVLAVVLNNRRPKTKEKRGNKWTQIQRSEVILSAFNVMKMDKNRKIRKWNMYNMSRASPQWNENGRWFVKCKYIFMNRCSSII